MTWRNAIRKVIWRVVDSGRKRRLKNDQIAEEIDKAYPLNNRNCYPYKIWLEERKKAVIYLGLIQPGERQPKAKIK